MLPSTIKRTRVLMYSVQFSGPTLTTFGLSQQILIAMLSMKFHGCPPLGAALTIQRDGHETNGGLSRLCERV
jgi:hypothetical protein